MSDCPSVSSEQDSIETYKGEPGTCPESSSHQIKIELGQNNIQPEVQNHGWDLKDMKGHWESHWPKIKSPLWNLYPLLMPCHYKYARSL